MNSPNQFIPVKDVGRGDGEGSVQVYLDEQIDAAKAKVFAAGDAVSGASLVVRAIAAGRKAANDVHDFLQK